MRKGVKAWIALVVACASMGVFAGGQKEASAASGSSGAPVYKDTIVIAQGSDQNYMDGQMNNTNDVLLRSVYSQLVRRAADNTIVGDLASSWEVSPDGLTWTFHLNKGVKFHSGKELTAKDVKASYDRLLDPAQKVRYAALVQGYIKACNVVDDYTVQLVTPSPIAPMLANLCHRSNLILNSDYIDKYGAELGLTAESVDGTGPYKLAKWDRDQEMVLERFDDYFKGAVPTKTIDVLIVSDANARLVALQTGEVDIATVSNSDYQTVIDDPDLKLGVFDSVGSYGLQFNCADPIIKDSRVRRAISYAIDRQTICSTLWAPTQDPVSTAPVNSTVWGYVNLGIPEYNPEKAKALLAEAGYPDGFSLSIMLYPGYSKSLEACEMIVAQLAQVGIKASIETVDSAQFHAAMGNRSYPGENFPWGMFFMGFGAGTADCDEGLRRIWQTSPDGNNNNNYGWYSNATVDKLLDEATVELDEAKRLDLYKQAEQILFLDDPAAIWLHDGKNAYAMSKKVSGFKVNVNTVFFFDELRCEK